MSISLLIFLLEPLASPTKIFRVVKRVVKLIGFQSFVFLILQSLYPSRKLSIMMEKHDFIYEIHPVLGWYQISEDVKVNFPFWLQLHSLSISFIANALSVFHLYESFSSPPFSSRHIHILCTLSIILLLLAFKTVLFKSIFKRICHMYYNIIFGYRL